MCWHDDAQAFEDLVNVEKRLRAGLIRKRDHQDGGDALSAGEVISDVTYVTGNDERALANEVNLFLADGWQPLGPVQITSHEAMGVFFVQTLVHCGEEE